MWRDRHRGPFILQISRPSNKPGRWKTTWLKGEITRADIKDEAEVLLKDPRDTIDAIHVWSLSEEQFVHTYRQEVRL